MLNSPVFGGPRATLASFASSVRGVERQDQPAPQLKHCDRPGRRHIVADELRADHPPRFEPKTVAVEPKRPIQIADSKRDYTDPRLHQRARL